MSSPTTNNRPTTSTKGVSYGRRQARAARRAIERERRNRILITIATILVVAAIVALFVTHNPFANAGKSSAVVHPTPNGCPVPTATPVGPVPQPTPPQSPPKETGKTITGQQGLEYIDITAGCGAAVKAGNTVTVIYHGWLQSTDKLFDSSFLHGGTFQVANVGQAQVITGWNLGLIGMKTDGTRRLIIPPAIGYGAQGQPPTIPANATLIFDITIVSIDS